MGTPKPCLASWRPAVRTWVDGRRVIACPACGQTFLDLDPDKPGAPLPPHPSTEAQR